MADEYIDFDEEEYEQLVISAVDANSPVDEFVKEAVREKLAEMAKRRTVH